MVPNFIILKIILIDFFCLLFQVSPIHGLIITDPVVMTSRCQSFKYVPTISFWISEITKFKLFSILTQMQYLANLGTIFMILWNKCIIMSLDNGFKGGVFDLISFNIIPLERLLNSTPRFTKKIDIIEFVAQVVKVDNWHFYQYRACQCHNVYLTCIKKLLELLPQWSGNAALINAHQMQVRCCTGFVKIILRYVHDDGVIFH